MLPPVPVMYIVTSHSDYYPRSGVEDWLIATLSEAEAREVFLANSGYNDDYKNLIRIMSDGTFSLLEQRELP